ncbi:MAG: twin-arginine translocase TatA/TatE family subunit [Gemmatimonadota bacterium]
MGTDSVLIASLFGIGSIGWTEGILIAFLFLLLFGARRLPEVGQSLGKGIREFKKSLMSTDDDVKVGTDDQEMTQVEAPKKEEVK